MIQPGSIVRFAEIPELHSQTLKRNLIVLGSFCVAIVAIVLWSPLSHDPVSIEFVRYEKSGNEWWAYMRIYNESSRPITYQSSGPAGVQYVWDSPQIDYTRRIGSRVKTCLRETATFFKFIY